MKSQIQNTSGWAPAGQAILLRATQLEDLRKEGSSVLIPDEVFQSSAARDVEGMVVAIGADAWKDITPRCEVGDRVRFTQFAGGVIKGDDGVIYRLINSHAVYAVRQEKAHG